MYNIYVSKNKIYKHRSGAQSVDSTTKQLVLENGKDVSKVFDRVWHKGLMNKLNFMV